jgi:RNA polymerase sigma-70 factor (ECF subfamily)
VEAKGQLEALKRAIVALSSEQRTPLVLQEFEACSCEKIAEVLDITVAAVKGRLHRARLQLLETMKPWA